MFTIVELDAQGEPGQRHWLVEGYSATLGASPRCDVALDEEALPLTCARIQRRARHYILQPVGSSRALRMDGAPVERPTRLRAGARFWLGPVQLMFRPGDHTPRPEQPLGPLEQLRALLYSDDTSPRAWEAICALFDQWPDPRSLPVGVDYAASHLRRWPRALCAAPEHWRARLLAGESDPRLRLPRLYGFRDAQISAAQMRRLTACPQLAQIEGLILPDWFLDDEVFAAFLQAPSLRGLRWLEVGCDQLTDRSARLLAARADLEGLQGLALYGPGFSGQSALALAQSPHMGNLQRLYMRGASAWGCDLEELLGDGRLPALACLRLPGCGLSGERLGDLPRLAPRPALEELHLSNNHLGDEGARLLAQSPLLAHLTELNLSNNGITEAGVAALAASPWIARLRLLRLSGNPIGADGARALAQSPSLRYLLSLEV